MDKEETKKERWVNIPGAEKYEIDLYFPFRVRNAKTKKVLKSKERNTVGLYVTGQPQRAYCIARLAYCAMHGIKSEDLAKDAIVRMDGKIPVLYRRKEIYGEIFKKLNERKRNLPIPIQKYEKEIEFATMVIQAFRSQNFKPVSDYLFTELQDMIVTYFTDTKTYSLPVDEAKSIACEAILLLINRIQKGAVISNPYNYARNIAIRVIKIERKRRKELLSYSDTLIYREIL